MKHLVQINQRSLPEDTDLATEFRYVDISSVDRGRLVKEPQLMTFGEAPSRARRLVRAGDIIVSTVRTYLRAAWPVTGDTDDLVVSTGFAVISPVDLIPRFLQWWCQSDPFIEEIVARSTGVSYPAMNALDLETFPTPVPPNRQQIAIADFLDAETARLDALIIKKRAQLELLQERIRTSADLAFESIREWRPLKHAVVTEPDSIIAGPFGSDLAGSDLLQNGPVPVFDQRTVIQREFGSFQHFVTKEKALSLGRFWVLPGDLLVTGRGTIGKVTLVPGGSPPGILHPCLLRVRLDSSKAVPGFVEKALRYSRRIAHYFALQSTATTIDVIYGKTLVEVSIPLPSLDTQIDILDRLSGDIRHQRQLEAVLSAQISLIQERRQALITAAVTGQLDIPGVAA